jgi:alpha-tubulin suppressor-like RCC1 family protein
VPVNNSHAATPQIAVGNSLTVVIKSDGTLWSCGLNFNGQLGLGDTTDRHSLVQVGTDNKWVSISTRGSLYAMAIKSDGTLWAWGSNTVGELGLGDTTDRHSPVQVGTDTNWVSVSAGGEYTIALKSDGTLWSWGWNNYGQLGLGDTTDRYSPVQVGTDINWVSVSAGSYHVMALKSDGTLWAWGKNNLGELGLGDTTDRHSPVQVGTDNKWVSIEASGDYTLALKSDGTLWAWGLNGGGCLGLGDTMVRYSPVQVGTDNKWVSISTGQGLHSMGIKSDGTLWAWGLNSNGELGLGDTIDRHSPVQVGSDNKWVSIAAGDLNTIALRSDGTLWAWGDNFYGQLGDGATTDSHVPEQITTVKTDWSSIAGGCFHTTALKSDGTLWAWGGNFDGQLGLGDTTQRNSPVQVGSDNKWVSIAGSCDSTIALKSDGTLWAWGYNNDGQLGLGDTTDKYSPVQVGSDDKWVSIAGGGDHTVALKSDGTLWAWGGNFDGQLGLGDTTDRHSPVQVGSENKWVSIKGGGAHNIALKADGTVWTWGLNDRGQLGYTSLETCGGHACSTSPGQVGSDNRWVLVSAGSYHIMALKSDGTLWAWGYNNYGQLGLGDTTDKYSPVQVGSDNNWVSITAGWAHTIALKSDGTLWAWGYNDKGQLGLGDTTDRHSPVQVGSDNKWVSIAAGQNAYESYTIALKSDGTLWVWGDNSSGQLGLGDTTDRWSPVQLTDSDLDGIPDDVDNCPAVYNPNQKDTDGDGIGDVCDTCTTVPNGPNRGTCTAGSYIGSICYAQVDCGTSGFCSLNQEDTDGDGLGDACDNPDPAHSISEKIVDIPGTDIKPGEPLWVKATFKNNSDHNIDIITPDCYNTFFMVTQKNTGEILPTICRIPAAYGIPTDVHTIEAGKEFSITCDLSLMYSSNFLTSGGPTTPITYSVMATYANFITDPDIIGGVCISPPCSNLWTGAVSAPSRDVTINGNPVVKKQAQIVFDPALWDVNWASPPITASISNIEGHSVNNVVPSTIMLNGTVPIIPGSAIIQAGVLKVKFDGGDAVRSLGTAIPGTTVYPTVQGGFNPSYYPNEIFYGQGRADLYDSVLSAVQVVRPNGGEVIPSGSTYSITWGGPPAAAKFDIGYSCTPGTWTLIASNITGTYYNWTMPKPLRNEGNCRVAVRGYNLFGGIVGTDTSDNPFTIEVVKVTSPNGGEILPTVSGCRAFDITWSTNGTASPVSKTMIYGSGNGGTTWKLITTIPGNPGVYHWNVPSVASPKPNCKIGVVLKDAFGNTLGWDISDANFIVQP